ncbi:MAG TPA: DUF6585 family protein [Gemmata sp.]|nr:DUF6585 family protein [Gemmata sp.]
MLHFKCPQCKKFIPIADEKAGENPVCADCGTKLVLLKPVEGAPDKGKEKPRPVPKPSPIENRRGDDEEVDRVEDTVPKPKKKSKKKKPVLESDEDEEEVLKPRKKRGSKKSERDDDDDEDMPPRMYGEGEGEDVLGKRKEVFTQGNSAIRIMAISCCVLAAAGMLSCVLSTVTKLPDTLIPFIIISIVGGLGGFLWCMKYLTLKVALHAGGIVHSHRAKTQIIPWEEIASVYYSVAEVSGGKKFVYTIELKDRTQFIYTSSTIKDVDRLGNIIIEKTSALILPQVRVKVDRGDMFDFGRLGVKTEGLHYKKQVLAWKDIEGVRIMDGYIEVCRKGKWVRWRDIEASTIPNVQTFLAFANEVVESQAE